jgi:transposase InsO family protein
VDFIEKWAEKTALSRQKLVLWAGLYRSRYYDWHGRYGKANEHNGKIPRDYWLEDYEKEAIISFYLRHPLNGYRRLAFMMMDRNVVFVSPRTVHRVLAKEGLLDRRNRKPSKKGTGFHQPDGPHRHWHVDVSYINISGTFYYMCALLDGYSRYIVHWDIKEQMKESDIELICQKALEKFPEVKPRIISDNGPQFKSRDFKNFIRLAGMDHVCTSPYYPQSNGKIERWHREYKETCIRPTAPSSLEEAKQATARFIDEYNNVRLHSAIGYIAPIDKLLGKESEIFKARDEKLARARSARKLKRAGQKPISETSAGGYGSAEEQPERQADRGETKPPMGAGDEPMARFPAPNALNLGGLGAAPPGKKVPA